MSFAFPLSTTGALSFNDHLIAPEQDLALRLDQATTARAGLRGVLKDDKRTADGQRDPNAIVAAVENYLPFLGAILGSIQSDDVLLRSEPTFSWRPALTQSILSSPARLPFGSFLAEHIFTLYTYLASLALSASLLARSQSSAADGGRSYELSPKVSPAERKIRDEHVGRAADALCRAAGVAEHLVPLVGEWERLFDDGGPSSRGGGGIASRLSGNRGSASRPVESSRAFASALAKLLLADAQALSIRKLLSPTLASSPHVGPPLAKGHPSPSLLAKLYLSVLDLYTQAGTLLTSSSSSRSKGSDDSTTDGPVSDLVRYVGQNRAFVQALARKWLGVDAGESGKAERMGEAVAWLRDAKATLIEGGASSGGKGSSGGSGGGLLKKSKSKVENRWTEELESVSAFLSAYEKLNNSVYFTPIPPLSSLLPLVPAGRAVLAVKPYVPPLPAFGPGSEGYATRGGGGTGLEDGFGHLAIGDDSRGSEPPAAPGDGYY